MKGGVKSIKILVLILILIFVAAWSDSGWAEEGQAEILKRLDDLTRTVQKQQEMLKQQAEEIQTLKGMLKQQETAAESNRRKITEVDQKTAKKAGWTDRLDLSTDLRLRYEGILNRQAGNNEIDDRHRFRIRWRVFGDYRLSDGLSLHSMVMTGSGSWFNNGTSSRNWQPGRTSNQTMDDEFSQKDIYIGRMYAAWKPAAVPGLEINAGKFKNTFLNTDIMWDPDVNPEGASERYQWTWGKARPFIHLGQMVVAENNRTEDAYLFVYQAGSEFNLGKDIKWTLAASYYDWQNLDKSDLSQVENSAAGNTINAVGDYLYYYKLVQGITFLDFKVGGLPVRLWLDYIVNTAEELPENGDTAWSTGFTLGKTKKKGDWAFYVKYAQIESDAVVGAVADGDFYGTNRTGYKVQAQYQLADPVQMALSWFQTDALNGPEDSEDRIQLDFIFRFGP